MNVLKVITLIMFLMIAFGSVAAEFDYKDTTVRSYTRTDATACAGYDIIIEQEVFPDEHEEHVPDGFGVTGFYGGNHILSSEVRVMKDGDALFPEYGKSALLEEEVIPGRTYIPYKALCKGREFVVFYWSGGNCDKCEFALEYRASKVGVRHPMVIGVKAVRDKYRDL